MKEYAVSRKIRGVQTILVNAKNKKEALRLVDSNDDSVEGVDFEIDWYGKAFGAIPQKTPDQG
jgi:hypothetical protein